MDDSYRKIQYREGELENLLKFRNKFVHLLEPYIQDSKNMSKGKMLGTIFDTIFYIGICNMRAYFPSVKEIYLSVEEIRNTTLRQLDFLEEHKIITRIQDQTDSRIKRVKLTEMFQNDFEQFMETSIDTRIKH